MTMRTLVRKMAKPGLMKIRTIVGTVAMGVFALLIPVGLIAIGTDKEVLLNPYMLGVMAFAFLFFAGVAYLRYIRPYRQYLREPEVLAETDGEFLYVHGKREAKIPLAELADAGVQTILPYLYQKEFLDDILLHMFSEKYGDLYLHVPGHKAYKMRYVSRVEETADELIRFIREEAIGE